MSIPKIVSYATPSYADEMLGLKATASELGLHVHDLAIHEMTWADAVCFKPNFIYDRVASLESCYDGLLWTDADSRFRRMPDWDFFAGVDFSCHRFKRTPLCDPEFLSGTMYFGRGKNVLPFIADWISYTRLFTKSDTPEQRSLKIAFEKWDSRLSFIDIGPSMCWVFDDFVRIYPGMSPTVEHFQASRRMRK